MEDVPQNKKLNSPLDYFAQQLMENQNVPIEMWNVRSIGIRPTVQSRFGVAN